MDEEKRYQEAKARVMELKGFYTHFTVFLIVNCALFLVDMISSPNVIWFHWAIFGWGIGILVHTIYMFGILGLFGKRWEERKIKEIMKKSKNLI